MRKSLLICLSCLAVSCTVKTVPDVGTGFEVHGLHAPWDGLSNDTRFTCHSSTDRFFFNFEVTDSTLTVTDPYSGERDVEPEDRVEIFFSPDIKLKNYHCAEMDAMGRVLDYEAHYYREMDYDWDFSTLEIRTSILDWGYRVAGSISLDELRSLGIDTGKDFYMGVFQADFKPDGSAHWYSFIPKYDVEPDFHVPDVFFRCRMSPMPERRGVVVYPSDITSVGIEEWARRFEQSSINLVGIHAATTHEPLDILEDFVKSDDGRAFLALCEERGVDVEYEIHALQLLLPREEFDTHPEWFREDEDGVRQREYNMCFSSTEAVEAMRPRIKALLEWMHPTTHRYLIWTDDKIGKFCHCAECRDYSPSEQALLYENALLKVLRDYDPEATIAHLAYNQTLAAPEKVRAAEGVFLEFAPIKRDYSTPLSDEALDAYLENTLAFPTWSKHILEYWLDESMFSGWKRDSLVLMPFHKEECARDIKTYRRSGAGSITTFATWLGGDYLDEFGPTDSLFAGYGESFK